MIFIKAIIKTALLAMLAGRGGAMDLTMKSKALQAYTTWFPELQGVHYQDATYTTHFLDYLREEVKWMKVVELDASLKHRYFLVPLTNMRPRHEMFGLPNQKLKNYFAAFRVPWEGETSTFAGVGAIKGIRQTDFAQKLKESISAFTPEEYGIVLNVP